MFIMNKKIISKRLLIMFKLLDLILNMYEFIIVED